MKALHDLILRPASAFLVTVAVIFGLYCSFSLWRMTSRASDASEPPSAEVWAEAETWAGVEP